MRADGGGSRTSVRRTLAYSFVESWAVLALQLLASMAVARLLTREEIGVYAVAIGAVGLAQTFRDFGVSTFIVQQTELGEARLRAALAVSYASSWTLAGLVFAASWPLAAFYAEPRLRGVLWALAFNFLLVPGSAVTMAVLRRELRARATFTIRLASVLASSAASIGLAAGGWGPLSLALGAVAGQAVFLGVAEWHRPPGLPRRPSRRGMGAVVRISAMTTASSLSGELAQAAPDLALGRLAGMDAVAVFGRAVGLTQMVQRLLFQALWSVSMPYFAQRLREGRPPVPAWERALAYVTGLVWPAYLLIALLAEPLLLTLFGPQWAMSAPPLRLLCLQGAIAALGLFTSPMLLAAQRVREEMRLMLASHGLRAVGVVLAAHAGLMAVAWTLVGVSVVTTAMGLAVLKHRFACSAGGALRAVSRSLVVTGLLAAACLPLVRALPAGAHSWAQLILVGLVAAAVWGVALVLVRHPLTEEWRRLRGRLA